MDQVSLSDIVKGAWEEIKAFCQSCFRHLTLSNLLAGGSISF